MEDARPGRDPAAGSADAGEQGGDAACWAHLVCPECGAIPDDGGHREGCPAAASAEPRDA